MAQDKLTPLMRQYFSIREQYPDALLFFQVGDFYELFFEDARIAASYLAITLTKRGKCKGEDVPLCGVPVHALSHYLTKLVRGGYKVALCDQLGDTIPGQVVERGVRQVFTPGTLTEMEMLKSDDPSYLLSFFPQRDRWGMVFGELLSADLHVTSLPNEAYRSLDAELARFFPSEIIVPKDGGIEKFARYFRTRGYFVSHGKPYDDLVSAPTSRAWLESQFGSSEVTRLSAQPALLGSMEQMHAYLSHTQKSSLSQFKRLTFYEPDDYLLLDAATQRNLEIVVNSQDGTRTGTLLSVINRCKTAMGSRMLKKWLVRPLVEKRAISARLEVVEAIRDDVALLQKLSDRLSEVPDLERIVGRIALGKTQLSDYLGLRAALSLAPDLHRLLTVLSGKHLADSLRARVHGFDQLLEVLERSLADDVNGPILIKEGFDAPLDDVRALAKNAQKEILALESREIKRSGITSLKIRYNKLSGYSIEVTKKNAPNVPLDYIRQQTLTNRVRFTTSELMSLESKILNADSEAQRLELAAFERVKLAIVPHISALRALAHGISYLDALNSFSLCAYENNYVRPIFNENRALTISEGRHPVVEQFCDGGFIPNNTSLCDEQSLWVVTGPNMGGKSTYLRQVALISVLAQCGSLVPAASANLSILDRIFTRLGAGDNLREGKSTFLVEMEETATICHQATDRSLVILDEVGRGTSTFDGLAIAQAVIEHIFSSIKARCLFATHYHELTALAEKIPGIKNYYLVSKKEGDRLLFLHKIMQGISAGSFGLEVARLAQMPPEVIKRAGTILRELERVENKKGRDAFMKKDPIDDEKKIMQLREEVRHLQARGSEVEKKMVALDQVITRLSEVHLDELTPRRAFDLLWEIIPKLHK